MSSEVENMSGPSAEMGTENVRKSPRINSGMTFQESYWQIIDNKQREYGYKNKAEWVEKAIDTALAVEKGQLSSKSHEVVILQAKSHWEAVQKIIQTLIDESENAEKIAEEKFRGQIEGRNALAKTLSDTQKALADKQQELDEAAKIIQDAKEKNEQLNEALKNTNEALKTTKESISEVKETLMSAQQLNSQLTAERDKAEERHKAEIDKIIEIVKAAAPLNNNISSIVSEIKKAVGVD